MAELTNITNQTLIPGENTFDNIDLGEKIYKINFVKIESDNKTAIEIKSITYSRNTATIILNNTTESDISCNIIIYGQTMKENKLFVKKNKSNSSNEILEVTNKILPESYIGNFADNLLSLIGVKNSALSLYGFFNPRIKLGDTLYVDIEKSINTKGYYKVTELKWKITNVIKCEAKVIKTIVQDNGGV